MIRLLYFKVNATITAKNEVAYHACSYNYSSHALVLIL